MDGRGQDRCCWPAKGRFPAVALCVLLGLPSLTLAGMFDTPLPTFSDGKPARVVGLLPRVIKNHNLETVVACTNLDVVAANIGLEVFDKDGVLANSDPNSGIAAGNGAILNVAVGATRTITTSGTVVVTDDHRITGLPNLRNGSGRVLATSKTLSSTAILVDEVHAIVDPVLCPTCQPPVLAHLPLIRMP